VRTFIWVLVLAACRPTATVQRTTPVANLQSFHTVGLRVRAAASYANFLQRQLLGYLRQQCSFEQIVQAGPGADLIIDLNVTGSHRGGGVISNASQATVDTLLVLSDGPSGELLGTARIQGKSSGMIVNGSSPEGEALNIVAKTVADVLATSGCSGPRVARNETPPPPPPDSGSAAPPPPPPDSGSAAPPPPARDESHRQDAEALNEQGKDKLRSADIDGALAAFQQANTLLPDAKYEFNVCLAFEAGEKWNDAMSACRQARGMSPEPRLLVKIDARISLIQKRQ